MYFSRTATAAACHIFQGFLQSDIRPLLRSSTFIIFIAGLCVNIWKSDNAHSQNPPWAGQEIAFGGLALPLMILLLLVFRLDAWKNNISTLNQRVCDKYPVGPWPSGGLLSSYLYSFLLRHCRLLKEPPARPKPGFLLFFLSSFVCICKAKWRSKIAVIPYRIPVDIVLIFMFFCAILFP